MPILTEVSLLFALIMARIWIFDKMGWITVAATAIPISLAAFSWYKRGDNLKSLGVAPDDFSKDFKLIAATFLTLWAIVMTIAVFWNPIALSNPDLLYKFGKHAVLYFFWALLQQLWCNGYFVNRLNACLKNTTLTSLLTGLLFGIIHLPNPVLFTATFIGGALSAHFFQRNRNLYWLALGHALLAVSIHKFLPPLWHHNLRIGWDFWTWTP